MKKTIDKLLLLLLFVSSSLAQPTEKILIDQVAAVVGNQVILHSDIENEYQQMLLQGSTKGFRAKCAILEEMMFQKLLLTQADIDSITVTDKQVESELDRRLRYFISQVGSKENLEAYFNKTILEIKKDLRDKIRDYLLIQNVQSKLTQNVKITPSEVTEFFHSIPQDSLPLIGSQLEVAQIVIKPVVSDEEIQNVKNKLNTLRTRILNGESFAVLANLYSEDPGSMKKGGELGFVGRGELYPEFEVAAFALKPGEVSPIVKTEKGYHIIQMIERRGENINVRHILLIPKASPEDKTNAFKKLQHIADLIAKDSISFEKAAALYSDDPSKINGGLMTNPYTGDSKFSPDEIDPDIYFTIEKMNPGDVSPILSFTDDDGQQAYRILKLVSRTNPHKANLKDDYSQIQNMALALKQAEVLGKWVLDKTKTTYINISDTYKDCNFKYKWIENNK